MPEPRVKITIVDDTASPQTCTGSCGVDWSKPESVAEARRQVAERFGSLAELEYLDLPTAARSPSTRKARAVIKGMPLPVLLANGKPRIAGEFDTRQILDVIEVGLEAEL